MKKVILFFAVAAIFAACTPKQAEKAEATTDSVATQVVDTTAAVVDSAAVVADSAATAVVK
ncbi:MAG: hypothetical protein H6Q18_399 [Bacteroidetes bacterium]|nr:hypothetical protein [Bacteroidota bacterium]